MGHPFCVGLDCGSPLHVGVVGFAELELEGHLAAVADDGDADDVAGLVLFHDGADVLRIGDLLAVDGHNQIAAEQDGLLPT